MPVQGVGDLLFKVERMGWLSNLRGIIKVGVSEKELTPTKLT